MMFLRGGDGGLLAEFSAEEADVISTLATQVGHLVAGRVGVPGDPAITRLLPTAYPDDPESAAEFRRFTENDLAARKIRNAETVIATLGGGGKIELDEAAAQAWLRTLTDIRLTLAARLGITLDDELGNQSSDEAVMMRQVYDWLGYVQESLVSALDD